MLLLTMSWEDNEDLLPSQQPSPAPTSGGLNPNASSFSFNPGASTFAPSFAPSPPPARASQHAAEVAPTQPTPHENSHIDHPASHSALPNGIAPMDEDEPAAVPDSTAGPSGRYPHPGRRHGNLRLAACHKRFTSCLHGHGSRSECMPCLRGSSHCAGDPVASAADAVQDMHISSEAPQPPAAQQSSSTATEKDRHIPFSALT